MVGGIQNCLSTSSDMFAQMREKMFARLDGDGDGQIDLAALTAKVNADGNNNTHLSRLLERLKSADTNGDGMVSKEEFDAMKPPQGGPDGKAMTAEMMAKMQETIFAQLDSDGDGQIDLAQVAAEYDASGDVNPAQTRFLEALKAADTDGDGKVSWQEFSAMKPPERPDTTPAQAVYNQDATSAPAVDLSGNLLDLLG
jgi:Ca2+-binding EF-hand superfamily protein